MLNHVVDIQILVGNTWCIHELIDELMSALYSIHSIEELNLLERLYLIGTLGPFSVDFIYGITRSEYLYSQRALRQL